MEYKKEMDMTKAPLIGYHLMDMAVKSLLHKPQQVFVVEKEQEKYTRKAHELLPINLSARQRNAKQPVRITNWASKLENNNLSSFLHLLQEIRPGKLDHNAAFKMLHPISNLKSEKSDSEENAALFELLCACVPK